MSHSLNSLKVLLWQHMVVRKRRYVSTLMELLTPLVIFVILFSIRGYFQSNFKSTQQFDSVMVSDPQPFMLHNDLERIIYSPEDNNTRSIMEKVGKNLGLLPLNTKPDHYSVGYWATDDISVLNNYAQDARNYNEAIVLFEKTVDGLKYTIRIKDQFQTGIVKSFDGTYGPHERYGTIYESFMFLQWAIDTSYIELQSNDRITQSPMFQEFPYSMSLYFRNLEIISSLLQLASYISLFVPFLTLFTRLLEARCQGIQELIKMVGVTPNMLAISHFCNVLPAILSFSVVGSILLKVSSTPLVPNTNGFLIFVALFLHATSLISMAFATSYIPKSLNYSSTMATFCHIFLLLPCTLIKDKISNKFLIYLTGFLPHVPVTWFWNEMAAVEKFDDGLGINDIFTSYDVHSAPVAFAYLMMLVQIGIFFTLAWYLDKVRPGPYGVALPWNFLFQKSFWSNKKVVPDDVSEEMVIHEAEARYFEDPPVHMDIGIKIVNVSKVYDCMHGPKIVALSNLSLDIYKGEITVLVGHNGAGKTTLMSIITGMTGATEGEVYVNGLNTKHEGAKVKRDFGFCPQHNLAFSDLTVQEHIIMFAMLKGLSYASAKKSSRDLVSRLHLDGKEDSKSAELSGGMKRRLQLACALAGGASVLVLDEPTSGLDVETRRQLWDLLLSLRGTCTVLISTHFMEEADALGDRVAAIHAGRLRSFATPMFLKRAIGTGYRLSLTINRNADPKAITDAIHTKLLGATLSDQTATTLTYKLPADSSEKFPELFNMLEKNRDAHGIDTMGVGVTTLEEVFLRLCSDADYTELDISSTDHVPTSFDKVRGLSLYTNIFWILLLRQLKATLSMKWLFLSLQCIGPIIAIFMFTYTFNNQNVESLLNPAKELNLDLYLGAPYKILYDLEDTRAIDVLKKSYANVEFLESKDIINDITSVAQDKTEYNKYLFGLEMNTANTTIYYTTVVRHAAPVALNMLNNLLAAKNLQLSDLKTVTTVNHPIESNFKVVTMIEAKSVINCSIWAVMIALFMMLTLTNESALPCRERIQGSRHYHLMSGCPPAFYWLITLLYDLAAYVAIMLTSVIVACIIYDYDHTLNNGDFLGVFFLHLLVGGISFLMFVYFVSFFFAERVCGIILSIVIFGFGMIAPLVTMGADALSQTGVVVKLFHYLGHLVPAYPFAVGALKLTDTARLNAYCVLNRASCPNVQPLDDNYDVEKCCASTSHTPFTYMKIDNDGYELIILFIHMVIYGAFVLLMDYGVWNKIVDKMFNANYKPLEHKYHDHLAMEERKYVSQIHSSNKADDNAAYVNNLHKRYKSLFRKPIYAVRGTSFSVKKGECFGLLGVNGAGKSTTFKMLTAEEAITRGDACVNGLCLSENRSKYLYSLGYCPQFGGVDPFLSGYDNLRVLLTIRGLRAHDIQKEANAWIQCVGLEKMAHRPVGTYSGGCNRRLAAAAALASDGAVSLLDEPTAGVDAVARRRVWTALKRALAQNKAIIITSHSMDEMEALCNRIAIMSDGEICALGSSAALRAEHGAGYALRLKLKHGDGRNENYDELDSSNIGVPLDKLKTEIQRKFQTQLKDEHKTMLHYHINDKVPYSQLFQFLETLKQSYGTVLEDYSITETTLEEVFLSFAKHEGEERGPNMV